MLAGSLSKISRNFKRYAANILISCVSICIAFVLVELGARIYDRFDPPELSMVEFRARQPLPYQNASYFSQEFLEESFNINHGFQFPEGKRIIIPNDFNGKYFNVINGRRATKYQPKDYINTVHVFGGSTVYGYEVPDEYTVASQLQLLFNKYYGSQYIVQNYGIISATTTQQLERLRTVSLRHQDIVIFYHGVNDIIQALFRGNPQETFVETNRRIMQQMSFLQKNLVHLSSYSKFVERWANPINNKKKIPLHLQDERRFSFLLDLTEGQYKVNILEAYQYTKAANAHFFHFLQPNIYTLSKLSEYERKVISNPNLFAPRGMEISFQKGYPRLIKVNNRLFEEQQLDCYDLTHVLDNRENQGEEYYLDTCHVSHKANQIIAQHIFLKIHSKLNVE